MRAVSLTSLPHCRSVGCDTRSIQTLIASPLGLRVLGFELLLELSEEEAVPLLLHVLRQVERVRSLESLVDEKRVVQDGELVPGDV